jgi:F-type H+-transporting ATPase subunit b
MILLMRQGFGFNTNLFETNILNLTVVVGIVVTIVGDAVRSSLDQRRQTILARLQEADQKAREAETRLNEAQKAVETSRLRAKEICIQAVQIAEQESSIMKNQIKEDMKRLQERGRQAIQLERQKAIQSIAQKVATSALTRAENTLLSSFSPMKTNNRSVSKQKELNEVHTHKTLAQLKRS